MRKIGFWAVLLMTALTASLFAQGVPAPYTSRLQTFLPVGVVSRPVLLRSAKDGSKRIFIVQQTGIIKVLQPGSTTPTDFINLSSKTVVPTSSGDERGLLGMTFHPQFATNGKFYVDYTQVGTGTTVVAEYTTTTGNGNSNTGDINSERVLFTIPQPFSNHNGGMVEFGPDGYLYIGTGDGGSANDPGNRAQNRSLLLGKMLRIDVNIPQGSNVPYLIPPTNPFTGAGTARCDTGSTTSGTTCQELYTIGMRNPWRWSFDRGGTNQLWIADVGQGAIEEVDIGISGANYGWRVYEGNSCTNIDPSLCIPANYTPPVFQYSHTNGRCSITGGYVYRGGQRNVPNGNYVYGDYCSAEIWRWDGSQQILMQDLSGRSILAFGEDEDGEIYVCYSTGQIDKIVRARASSDFDGDFKTDVSVFRPSDGAWYILHSSNNTYRVQGFGANGDIPTPEDYDGDNITDIGVFRPSDGTWYHFLSASNTVGIIQFGSNGDVPAAGDYDGDGKADFTVFRPSTGVWYRNNTSNGATVVEQFGITGDVPAVGDYDGDGKYDVSVWRPSNGTWYRRNSTNPSFIGAVQFGLNGDIPAQGDFDGDFKSDQAVFRNGTWYILQSSNGGVQIANWGLAGDVPVVGDYDGDGKDDIGVFRPSTGVWYILRSSNGAVQIAQFGLNGDLPVPNYDAP